MSTISGIDELPDVTPLPSGKVRERWLVGDDKILLVTSDRISAYDVVLPTPIPDKGKILTAMTTFWLDHLSGVIPNHLISTDPTTYGHGLEAFRDDLAGRSMLCHRAEPLAIECIARGYVAGSGWREYTETSEICGVRLTPGLVQAEQLERPIFTPATKAEIGDHDENIPFERAAQIVGEEIAEQARIVTLELYQKAAAHALSRGLIIADTKFEFGIVDGQLTLIDEVLTPDSSRFWDVETYDPGRSQPSFDKQFVRDWLETQPWDKTAPGPELPNDVVTHTRATYIEAYERLSEQSFSEWMNR